jgi:Tfp pilus assembly pilus retraction ATPase PilT
MNGAQLDALLQAAVDYEASDLHLVVGRAARLPRQRGDRPCRRRRA